MEEVAALLGVPKSTVYSKWRAWGLKGIRVGRNVKFRERDVEAWLERQTIN
ncbi:helix-turn-helix domain-containing protein [Nonomuraea endophytica]|uniref:Excisionase family DNA binding protein n=1 Tax=Nonomuraea endophytica TaxID=714136 RepID=A0A7W8EFV9_9ACTN|nr:helix-turn-helix domain-containing protein [Nonomuraea endophytica]MBB5077964.1 excisionase family DNA binding protein [Nonomuraea endophytica]